MKKNFKYLIALLTFISVSITACQKDNFDEPNITIEDPNLPVTHTIEELKALYTTLGSPLELTEDIIIQGVVIADDQSGNFYKQLIIDDGTAGIAIAIDANNLYTTYPVGRKIYVKCKGLFLGDYNGLIQLGGGIDQDDNAEVSRIVSTLLDEYIVRGPAYQTVTPIDVSIDELDDSYQNRLIRLSNVEFASGSAGKTWANAVTQQTVNHTLFDCNGNSILVRTSGYCSFASDITPRGNGTLVAVYSVYGSDQQLYIRNTEASEVNMEGIKCDGSSPDDIFLVYEDFESVSNYTNFSATGWTNWYSEGTKKWQGRILSASAKFVQMQAFGSPNQDVNVAWLVTPVFDLTATINDTLSFLSKDGYNNGATLEVLYSTDFTGSGDPSLATWNALPTAPVIASGSTSGYAPNYTPSGNISLDAINSATVSIAFKYTGGYNNPTQRTTTYQIDDIKVRGTVQ